MKDHFQLRARMKQGDFTALAKAYKNRTGYHPKLLRALVGLVCPSDRIAEVGAGTGKLTELLLKMNLPVIAIEPNDAMRKEGASSCPFADWRTGSGEETGLDDASADWVIMASSFHWTDPKKSLPEFHRILKPGGYLTVMWNPRNLQSSPFHMEVEENIHTLAPDIERRSSGSGRYTEHIAETLVTDGYFEDVLFMEASHNEVMSKERYMGAWESVNDIQAQAGPTVWTQILEMIQHKIQHLAEVVVPYKTRAWTVQKKNK